MSDISLFAIGFLVALPLGLPIGITIVYTLATWIDHRCCEHLWEAHITWAVCVKCGARHYSHE